MKYTALILSFVGGLMTSHGNGQQIYSNREWVEQSPVTGPGIYHTSTIVVSGKLYVTGNVLNVNGNTDIYTIKIDGSTGDTLWSKSYNGSATNSMDYGIELVESGGYIWVVGAAQNSGTGYDYCVLKYNSTTGTQTAVYNFNGTGNGEDIPSKLIVDGSTGSVYICGGSEASNGFSDYGTLCLSSSLSPVWSKYYDYNDLHDGATSLVFHGSDVVVTGGSAAAVGDWDIATVKYKKTTGSQVSVNRSNITGATMAEANAMTTDSLNNLYITGYAEVSGDRHVQTIKLDSTLSLIWLVNHNTGSGKDEGNDIGVDHNGHVYVTGYCEPANGKFQALTIKYDAVDADTLWVQTYGNIVSQNGMKARKMNVQINGDVYLTGTAYNGGLNSFSFAKFDSNGKLKLVREFQVDTLDDDAYALSVDGNEIYITGFTETISGRTMTSIKYSLVEKDTSVTYDSLGKPMYVSRELIVEVDPDLIDHAKIDMLELEYWNLSELFDSAFVTSFYRAVESPCSDPACEVQVYRIFSRLKTSDTITTSRLAKPIPVPPFWSAFIFEFPEDVNVVEISDSLDALFPDIHYTDYNYIIHLAEGANDLLYSDQGSIHELSGNDSAHVNVEPAWDYATGASFVRVGIVDDGIYYAHPDFGDGTLAGTKVVNGVNFQNNTSSFLVASQNAEHGTKVTGILAADRNDGIGIAGIAGGNDSIGNPGVSLYDLRIYQDDDQFQNPVSHVYDAIVWASMDTASTFGYGIHILNNSWFLNHFENTPENINLLRQSLRFANRAQVTFTACRGNYGTSEAVYPAVIEDNWVLSVGGTDIDGEYCPESSFGMNVDISAPASGDVAWTTEKFNTYMIFGGTSAATPHVSGAVALLMEYHNQPFQDPSNLAPEDCENLIQLSASDIAPAGYDNETGYGRLNIGNAMKMLAEDNCYIIHYGVSDSTDYIISVSQIGTDDYVTLNEHFGNADSVHFAPGTYRVDTYQVTFNFTYPYAISTDTLRAAWVRNSASNLFGLFGPSGIVYPRENSFIADVDENSAVIRGYAYKAYDIDHNFKGYWPHNPQVIPNPSEVSFTVFRCDTNLITAEMTESDLGSMIAIYPNPTNDSQLVVVTSTEGLDLSCELYDLTGKLIKTTYDGKTSDSQTLIPVSLANLPDGMYFYRISLDDKIFQVKAIKQ